MESPSSTTSTSSSNTSVAICRQPLVHREFIERLPRLWHGLVALLLASIAQFLIAGIEFLLGVNSSEFPASILAMAAVFCSFWVLGLLIPGVDEFYERHLRCAADLLNRHMSIGFTIPFIMICREPVADARTIGLIMACFIVTGFVNSVSAYFLALPIQSLVVRWDSRMWDCSAGDDQVPSGRRANIWRLSAKSTCDSDFLDTSLRESRATSRCETPEENRVIPEVVQSPVPASNETEGMWSVLCIWALYNPLLLLFWILAIAVGLPLRITVGHGTFFSICLLFAAWLTALAIQGGIKANETLRPSTRTLLSGLFNAVLWTSLILIAYAFADASISHRPIHDVLADLQTGTPMSKIISHIGTSPLDPCIAAGDIALSILNAGLVAWGLKLYEYRRHLLSRAGLTVFLVSSFLALANVVAGPLFAHTVGLRPASRDVAFAARSVTIALANPVMAMLKGDDGLNAAMVVVSGILYQMGLGLGVGAWLERRLTWDSNAQPLASSLSSPEISTPTNHHDTDTETTLTTGTPRRDLEAQTSSPELGPRSHVRQRQHVHDPRTVAAGVTIGINSAAMGTAYLYEANSDAAPYSALSMMALGIMTVGFSAIKPIAGWVMDRVADSA